MNKKRDWFYTIVGTLVIIIGFFMILTAVALGLYIWTVPIGVGGMILSMMGVMIGLMKKPVGVV